MWNRYLNNDKCINYIGNQFSKENDLTKFPVYNLILGKIPKILIIFYEKSK